MCLHLRIVCAAVPRCGARFELRTGAGSTSSVRSQWYPLTRTGAACSTRHTQTAYSLLDTTQGGMMASRRKPDPPGEPLVSAEVGIGLLRKQIDKARELLGARPLSSDAHSQWEL